MEQPACYEVPKGCVRAVLELENLVSLLVVVQELPGGL